MRIWSNIKKGFDFVFYIRPKQWVSWDFFKNSTQKTYGMLKDLYTIPSKGRVETFYQALARHGLTLEDVEQLKRKFYFLSMVFLSFSIGMFLYAADGFFNEQVLRGIGAVSLTIFLLAQSFRYHFWYFQLVEKRLGCSFSEWLNFCRN